MSYSADMSKILAECSHLAYLQYFTNDGKIKPPPGYTQVKSYTAYELDFLNVVQEFLYFTGDDEKKIIHTLENIDSMNMDFGKEVFFGFALTSAENNIISLRGTSNVFEWLLDMLIFQRNVPPSWYDKDYKKAKAHLGFMIMASFLVRQIWETASLLDPCKPLYFTGHSLGAALAVLLAPSFQHKNQQFTDVQMYNYGGPRVGDPDFVKAYNAQLSNSFRVVNLSDVTPMFPPTHTLSIHYEHVGVEWSFLNQSGDILPNHLLEAPNNYIAAVDACIPTDAPRHYPVTGL